MATLAMSALALDALPAPKHHYLASPPPAIHSKSTVAVAAADKDSSIYRIKHDHHTRHHSHGHGHTHVRRSFWNLQCSCLFSVLPDEILLFDVFAYFDIQQLCVLQSVCTRWKWLSSDRLLWSKLDLSPFAARLNDSALLSLLTRFGSSITSLKLCNCHKLTTEFFLSQSTLSAFASMTKLRELHLCNLRNVRDAAVVEIVKGAKCLETVSLYGCPAVTDVSLIAISDSCPKLTELSVRGCTKLTNQSLLSLPVTLEGLNIAGCRLITTDGLTAVAKRCHSSLQRLNAHGTVINDNAVEMIGSLCKSLQSLHLSSANPFGGNPQLTDSSIQSLSSSLSLPAPMKLTVLNLQGSSNLTDASLLSLLSLTSLQRLNLGGCYRLTDVGIKHLASSALRLTHLSIFQCFHVSDDSVTALLMHQPQLQHLDLHSCVSLTPAVLHVLGQLADDNSGEWKVPSLVSLDVGSCRLVTVEDVSPLRSIRPSLNIVHY